MVVSALAFNFLKTQMNYGARERRHCPVFCRLHGNKHDSYQNITSRPKPPDRALFGFGLSWEQIRLPIEKRSDYSD